MWISLKIQNFLQYFFFHISFQTHWGKKKYYNLYLIKPSLKSKLGPKNPRGFATRPTLFSLSLINFNLRTTFTISPSHFHLQAKRSVSASWYAEAKTTFLPLRRFQTTASASSFAAAPPCPSSAPAPAPSFPRSKATPPPSPPSWWSPPPLA